MAILFVELRDQSRPRRSLAPGGASLYVMSGDTLEQ
jgi:hypothetical protein